MTPKRFQATGTHFHNLVCRRQPACAIAMKIDRSGSLSFAASLRQSGPPFVIPAKAGIQKGGSVATSSPPGRGLR